MKLANHYILDDGNPLATTTNEQTTFFLPRLGEKQENWSYHLLEGLGSVRQIAGMDGKMNISLSFSP